MDARPVPENANHTDAKAAVLFSCGSSTSDDAPHVFSANHDRVDAGWITSRLAKLSLEGCAN